MIRAVVFDLGGVLVTGEGVIERPAELLGVDPAAFEKAYWAGRRRYDEGASDSAYWGPVLEAVGKPAALETVQQLAKMDAELWLQIRPEARQLLRDVRESGRPVAVLSNSPFSLDLGLLDCDFADEADHWFMSASMGVAKPHRGAYERVTEVLELEPYEIAFIDDRGENVTAAAEHGWAAHLWVSDADSRAWLEEIGAFEELPDLPTDPFGDLDGTDF